MKSKRIIFLTSQFPPGSGGIGTQAYQIASWLQKMGWEIVVISPQPYASEPEIEKFNQEQPFKVFRLKLLPFPPLKFAYRWIISSRFIKKFKPDILLASSDRDIYLTACLSIFFKIPWVAVEHGRMPPAWELALKRLAFHKADGVICVSQYTWNQMIRAGIKPRHGKVIWNGADPQRFSVLSDIEINRFKKEKNLNGKSLLITVGNVSERKGQDIVIRALPAIFKQIPNAHYLIAGVPTQKKEFEKIAISLGISDHVHFLGQVGDEELVRYLNASDVFVMTSRHANYEFEGYGIAVVEAALCGKPAIVSRESGLMEAIAEGETGLSVPEEDAGALAETVLSLLSRENLKKAMGEKARKRARDQQTWEYSAKQYEDFLKTLAAV